MKTRTQLSLVLLAFACLFSSPLFAQAPTPPTETPAIASTPSSIDGSAAVSNIAAPAADARANGDPDGSLTGTSVDVTVSDSKKGLTISDIANQVGQNKIAINFTWTLLCGF